MAVKERVPHFRPPKRARPGESGRALIVLLGIGLLLNGAFNIFDVVYVTRYVKEFKDYYHTNFDYSDVVDYQDDDRNN